MVAIYGTCNVAFHSKVLCFYISTLVVLLLLVLILLYSSVHGKWRAVVGCECGSELPGSIK